MPDRGQQKKYDVIHIGEANLDITVPDVPDEFFNDPEEVSAAGLDIPVLTRFADKLKTAIAAELPGIEFGKPEFDSYKEAASIVRSVRKEVKGRA